MNDDYQIMDGLKNVAKFGLVWAGATAMIFGASTLSKLACDYMEKREYAQLQEQFPQRENEPSHEYHQRLIFEPYKIEIFSNQKERDSAMQEVERLNSLCK